MCPSVGGGVATLGSLVLATVTVSISPRQILNNTISEVFEVSPEAVWTRGSLAGHSGEASVGAALGTLSCG